MDSLRGVRSHERLVGRCMNGIAAAQLWSLFAIGSA